MSSQHLVKRTSGSSLNYQAARRPLTDSNYLSTIPEDEIKENPVGVEENDILKEELAEIDTTTFDDTIQHDTTDDYNSENSSESEDEGDSPELEDEDFNFTMTVNF